jgi:sugar transferase (PEP-CTERM/EpsH1 system associated)
MRILFICHRFPYPPNGGAKVRAFNMIRHLSETGHKVTVCSLARSAEEAEEGKGIAPYCEAFEVGLVSMPVQLARMLMRLPSTASSSEGFFYSSSLKRAIDRFVATQEWDLIVVHCSSVAQYVEDVRDIPKLLDFCDMDSQKWLDYVDYKPFPLSLGYTLEGRKIRAAEKRLARKFDVSTVATVAERRILDAFATGASSDWFPNGVDTGFFSPSAEDYDVDTICVIGRMDYYPNEECMTRFCDEVWPLLRAARPAMKLLVVGAEPSLEVRKLAERPGVTVTGSVPDVRPFVRRSALSIAPLNIARGTQNKILEAMAMGVPVVTSPIAAAGVDAEPEHDLLVAETAADYVRQILRVCGDRQERRRLSEAGRARMLSHHTWPRAMQRMDGIIAACIARFAAAARRQA